MADKIGPNFYAELSAAGIPSAVAWNIETGALTRCLDVSDADFAKAEAVLAKHDPKKPGPAAPISVSGDALVGSFSDDQAQKVGMRSLARLAARPSVGADDDLLKIVATTLKTTPDAILATAAS
jgi:hypothetical protein